MKLTNPEIRIEPTNRCNAKCVMCPRELMTRKQGDMDICLFKSVIRQAKKLGATKVAIENYGEPLLDPYLFERAKFAKHLGFVASTITNGSLLTPLKSELMLKWFDSVRISFCGMSKESYEAVHGLPFDKSIEAINNFISMKSLLHNNTKIIMSFVVLDENESEIEDFIKTSGALVDGIQVWKPHNWSYGKSYRDTSGDKVSCNRPMAGPIQVQWDGKVVPCCFDYDSRVVLGDLNEQSLEEIVKGDAYNRLREAHREGRFSDYPMCDGCDQLHKDDSALVYTNIDGAKVGTTMSGLFKL